MKKLIFIFFLLTAGLYAQNQFAKIRTLNSFAGANDSIRMATALTALSANEELYIGKGTLATGVRDVGTQTIDSQQSGE